VRRRRRRRRRKRECDIFSVDLTFEKIGRSNVVVVEVAAAAAAVYSSPPVVWLLPLFLQLLL